MTREHATPAAVNRVVRWCTDCRLSLVTKQRMQLRPSTVTRKAVAAAARAHLHRLQLPEQPPLPGRVAAEHAGHVRQRAARQARQHKSAAHQHQALAEGGGPQGQRLEGGVQQGHAECHHAGHAQLRAEAAKGGWASDGCCPQLVGKPSSKHRS